MESKFHNLTKLSLLLVYLVIIAGAFVRMTGSGMGCPDWPKCFGFYVPPTEVSQILFKANNEYSKGQMILYNEEELLVAKSDFTSDDFINLNKGIPIAIPYIPEILDSNSIFKIGMSDYSNIIYGKKSE